MKLIDKDKVDEILRNLWKEDDGHNPEHRICYNKALQEVQCEIDTLEAKEVVTEQEGICNGILNRIIGDNWNLVIPLDKVGLKHGDKVKISIIKEQCKAQKGE
jgi:hypothetical protein